MAKVESKAKLEGTAKPKPAESRKTTPVKKPPTS
jgi:hypothetical protein